MGRFDEDGFELLADGGRSGRRLTVCCAINSLL